MGHRRKSSKRTVRCTICTTHRWKGNAVGRFKVKDEARVREFRKAKYETS